MEFESNQLTIFVTNLHYWFFIGKQQMPTRENRGIDDDVTHLQKGGKFQTFYFNNYHMQMNSHDDAQEKERLSISVQKLQDEALKRARNLRRRPVSSSRKQQHHDSKNKSHEKIVMITPEKKYSIEKVHEKNQIEFLSQLMHSKQMTRKMCAKIKLQKYSFQHVIGCGMFGKVWKVEQRTSHRLYAVKQVSKPLIVTKKGLATVMNERHLITKLHHHLIPNLISSFQTQLNLYLVLPLMEKGDLRYHIAKFKQFEEREVRFFIACIVSVLEYLRQSQIVHRDIKPENLLLDQSGYLYLTDFGIAQKEAECVAGNCCGTPAYMAPETIFQKEHSFTVDYYALGVLLHEMMTGERPYLSSNRQQLKVLMSKHSAHIKKDMIPEGWSIESADFANKLLHRNPHNRLGSTGINEIKNHPWLKDFPWQKLEKRQLISPYCEPFNHWEVDFKQALCVKNKEELKIAEQSLTKGDLQELFYQFTFDGFEKSVQYTTKPSCQLKL